MIARLYVCFVTPTCSWCIKRCQSSALQGWETRVEISTIIIIWMLAKTWGITWAEADTQEFIIFHYLCHETVVWKIMQPIGRNIGENIILLSSKFRSPAPENETGKFDNNNDCQNMSNNMGKSRHPGIIFYCTFVTRCIKKKNELIGRATWIYCCFLGFEFFKNIIEIPCVMR